MSRHLPAPSPGNLGLSKSAPTWVRVKTVAVLPGLLLAAGPAPASEDPVLDWFIANSHELHVSPASAGSWRRSDIESRLAGVRVIGLGEPNHGTHEAHRLRDQFIRTAAFSFGMELVAFEAGHAATMALDDYVQGTSHEREQALSDLTWIWNNRETRALLEWLRAVNAGLPPERRIHLAGIDLAGNQATVDRLRSLYQRAPPFARADVEPALSLVERFEAELGRPVPDRGEITKSDATEARRRMERLAERVRGDRESRLRDLSDHAYQRLMLSVRVAIRFVRAMTSAATAPDPMLAWIDARDRGMAETMLDLVGGLRPEARAVVLAHNAHVSRADIPFGESAGAGNAPTLSSLGGRLAEALGGAYYPIGLVVGGEGDFLARHTDTGEWRSFAVPTPDPGSLTSMLQAVSDSSPGLGRGFISYIAEADGPAARWLASPRLQRVIGAGYSDANPMAYSRRVPPAEQYSALAFIPRATPARYLGHPSLQGLSAVAAGELADPFDVLGMAAAGGDRIAYGLGPVRFGELRVPTGRGPFPIAVLIHGGCWMNAADYRLMQPLAEALASQGVATWNLEYSRIGDEGGGWPGTFLDVGSGIDALRDLAPTHRLDLDRLVFVGHSSGGHLALWAASRPRLPDRTPLSTPSPLSPTGAVSVGGPGDLREANELVRSACGDSTLESLTGGSPTSLEWVSPAEALPLDVPQLLLGGALDEIVPFSLLEAYATRASARGDHAIARALAAAGHFEPLLPGTPAADEVIRSVVEMVER